MRHFFIKAFEVVVHIVVVIMLIGVIGTAVSIFTGNETVANLFSTLFDAGSVATLGTDPSAPDAAETEAQISSMTVGLFVLIGGLLYVTILAGVLYLGLGIYQNTRRMAAAMELLSQRI